MPTYTGRNRGEKPDTSTLYNTWGIHEAAYKDRTDESLDGVLSFPLSGAKTLQADTTPSDQAHFRVLNITGGIGGTITLPNCQKHYIVRVDPSASGDVGLTCGGAVALVSPGELTEVVCDGNNCYRATKLAKLTAPTQNDHAANKLYVDSQVFTAAAGQFPGQASNQARFLTTDGTVAGWSDPLPDQTNKSGYVLKTTGIARTGAYWGQAGFGGGADLTANYSVLFSDREKLFDANGTFTITLPALTNVDAAFSFYVCNVGTGDVTLATQAGLTLDGLTSYVVYPREVRLIYTTGTVWRSKVVAPFDIAVTASRTIQWPPGYGSYAGEGYGAGGGGAGGQNDIPQPSAGGGGAACTNFRIPSGSITVGTLANVTVAPATVGGSLNGTGADGGDSGINGLIFRGGRGASRQNPGAGSSVYNYSNQGHQILGGVCAGFEGAYGSTNGPFSTFYGGAGGGGSYLQNDNPYVNWQYWIGAQGSSSTWGGAGGGNGYHPQMAYQSDFQQYKGGQSVFGGSGGDGGNSGHPNGYDGIAPGGGGGGGYGGPTAGQGGYGGRGEVRLRGVI